MASACRGAGRADLSPPDQTREPVKGLERDEMEILYLASLAPSGHNLQPWTMKIVGPKHWVLGSDRNLRLPAVDPDNRELLLSLGAFLENLVVVARTFGYEAEIEIKATSPFDGEIADIRLRKARPVAFPLDKVRRRRTVRSGFSGTGDQGGGPAVHHPPRRGALPPVKVPSPHAFYFPNGSPIGNTLREGLIEANRIQAFRDPAQEELARWIRWSDKDARRYRNGLTPESMEIGGFAGWYVRNFYGPRSVLKKSFREQTVDIVAQQVRTCGGWLVVTSIDSGIPTLIAYGMAFERLFLKVRDRQIALHPMTQMLEEQESLKDDVAGRLGVTGSELDPRLGYLRSYPEPVSLRRPVSWFILS